jgi:hypothetical protein
MTIELRNESPNTFADISTEQYRTYKFPGGDEVRIEGPAYLAVTAGGHRLLDESGVSHYIPKGWLHLHWKAKEGKAHFVK